jgi:hypothetical protein
MNDKFDVPTDPAMLAARLRDFVGTTYGHRGAHLLAAADMLVGMATDLRLLRKGVSELARQTDAQHAADQKRIAELEAENSKLHDKYCEETWQRRRGRKPGDGWNV